VLTADDATSVTGGVCDGGVLTSVATLYTHPVCGVVSDGVFKNSHGVNVLAFWPVYLPGLDT